jgi:transposase
MVRWCRIDLKRVIAERFGVDFHPRYVGKLLHKLGFSHMSARPRHPAQDERIIEAFKKTYGPPRLQEVLAKMEIRAPRSS